MLAEKEKISNQSKRNAKKIAKIQYYLRINGFVQSDIARDLDISPAAVSRSLKGKSKISRVDEWLKENIKQMA